MKSLAAVFLVLAFACLAWPGSSRRFKDKNGLRGVGQSQAQKKPGKSILDELEEELGREHRQTIEDKLHELEEEMRTTFKALPKNGRGALEAPSARYALHRHFVQRYGWQVKGLESEGGAWDVDSPIQAMCDRVPAKMRQLFEARLGNYGLTLHELAVVAASMDQMIHTDVLARLKIVYEERRLKETDTLDWIKAFDVMRSYMGSFIMGSHTDKLTMAEVRTNRMNFDKKFTRAEGAVELLREVVKQAVPVYTSHNFSFELVASVMSSFGEHLGNFEDKECQVMKKRLLTMEHQPGSGRVRLGDFYTESKLRHFRESSDYLHSAGVLDESDPTDPKVIIPNYLGSPSNCVSPSGYYEICCFDECEELMDKVEAKLEAPMGTPEAIASLVSALRPSTTVGAGLPAELMELLEKVAGHHGGMVPIHGRLFMQWMHQAFPRECLHPSTTMQTRQDLYYMNSDVTNTERQIFAGIAAVQKIITPKKETEADGNLPAAMWTMDEQLVDAKTYKANTKSRGILDIISFAVGGFTAMAMTKLLFGYGHSCLGHKRVKVM